MAGIGHFGAGDDHAGGLGGVGGFDGHFFIVARLAPAGVGVFVFLEASLPIGFVGATIAEYVDVEGFGEILFDLVEISGDGVGAVAEAADGAESGVDVRDGFVDGVEHGFVVGPEFGEAAVLLTVEDVTAFEGWVGEGDADEIVGAGERSGTPDVVITFAAGDPDHEGDGFVGVVVGGDVDFAGGDGVVVVAIGEIGKLEGFGGVGLNPVGGPGVFFVPPGLDEGLGFGGEVGDLEGELFVVFVDEDGDFAVGEIGGDDFAFEGDAFLVRESVGGCGRDCEKEEGKERVCSHGGDSSRRRMLGQ